MTPTSLEPEHQPQHRRDAYRGRHYAPSPTPARRRRPVLTAVVALLAVMLAVLGVVAAFLSIDDEAPSASAPAAGEAPADEAVSRAADPTAEAAPARPADAPSPVGEQAPASADTGLASRLLVPPPAFVLLADATAGTGPLDVAGVVAFDGPGGLTVEDFAALGLSGAHSREWRGPQGTLHLLALDFALPEGAAQFVAQAGDPRNVRAGAQPLPVDEPAGVRAYLMHVGGTNLQVALFAHEDRAYVVGLQGQIAAEPTGDLLEDLALAQAASG